MKKIFSLILVGAMTLSLLVGCGKSSEKIEETTTVAETTTAEETTTAASATYQDTVTVNPDDSQDFDPFEMVITYTVENGILTSLDFSSTDWGRPALKQNPANARYCNKAIVTICKDLIDGKAEEDIDVVSGATCTSKSFKESLKNVADKNLISWSAVSPELVYTIDGEALSDEEVEELLNADLNAEEEAETAGENGQNAKGESSEGGQDGKGGQGGQGGQGGNKGGSSIELPDGYGLTASFGERNADGWLPITIEANLPDGYVLGDINVIRVGNTAYMAMKDPDAFNTLFSYDVDSHVLLANVDSEYMTSTSLTISISCTAGEEEGKLEIIVDTTGK